MRDHSRGFEFTFAAPVTHAGPSDNCDEWVCGMNGTQLTGLALGSASTGTVSAVILPTGEVLDPR